MTQRRRSLPLLILSTLPIYMLILACGAGAGTPVTTAPRWACPTPTPKPYGPAPAPPKREWEDCDTDPVTGERHCDKKREDWAIWEQEGGEPETIGMTGSTYVFGQRVEIWPFHITVTARPGPLVSATPAPASPAATPTIAQGRQQVYSIQIDWINHTTESLPFDYGFDAQITGVTATDGHIITGSGWPMRDDALALTGIARPANVVPAGESSVTFPIIAPAGQVKMLALKFAPGVVQPPAEGGGPGGGTPGGGGGGPGTPGGMSVVGAASITAAQIDTILARAGSPAAGTGAIWIALGMRYGIDPVFGLAFYKKESSFGTDPVHQLPHGGNSHNVGNIISTPGWPAKVCTGTHCFRAYPSWQDGIEDWFRLIRTSYVNNGLDTVEAILPIYAPSSENDTQRYINQVRGWVLSWRGQQTQQDTQELRDLRTQPLTVQWASGTLRDACPYGPGVLTDWNSGHEPITVAAPPGADRVVQLALNQLGKPYVWGAAGPDSFDCSGLMQWSYAQVGITIPRTTATQFPALRQVSRSELIPGDLAYMDTNDPPNGSVTHVGMLVGDLDGDGSWDLVHAASPKFGIRIEYNVFAQPYYKDRFLGFRRVR